MLWKHFGPKIFVFYWIQSLLALLLVEVINYVQHYGLERKIDEPVKPKHCWNSYYYIVNRILFNLPRHSDHHINSMKRYQNLKYMHNTPELPYSYPIVILIALIPPLWKDIMNPKCKEWNK